jgi:hypothetical protein
MMRVRGMFNAWRLGMRIVSVMSMRWRCAHERQQAAQHRHPSDLQQFAHAAFYHDSAPLRGITVTACCEACRRET